MDITYGYVCISMMEISHEYTWICKVEYGYVWIPSWITAWIMQGYVFGYKIWISLKIFDGYQWICMDMYGYP
jgi:hypothetical protein